MSSPRVTHLALCSVLTLLAACGGGGGGGDSTPTPTKPTGLAIDSSNQKAAAAAGAQAVLVGSHLVDTATSSGQSAPGGTLALDASRDALRKTIQRALPAAAAPTPTPCTGGGTSTFAYADNNGNNQLDAGDSFTSSYQACVGSDGSVTNGTITLVVQQIQQTGDNINATLDASFTNFSVVNTTGGSRLNGAMRVTTNGSSFEGNPDPNSCIASTNGATFTQFVADELAANSSVLRTTTLTNGTISEQIGVDCSSAVTVTETANGTWTGITGTLALTTPATILSGPDGIPYAGSFTVAADTGKILVSFAAGGNSQLQLDANGDGTYESSTALTWADLGIN